MAKQVVIRVYENNQTQEEYTTDQEFDSWNEATKHASRYNKGRRRHETEVEKLSGRYPTRIARAIIYEV